MNSLLAYGIPIIGGTVAQTVLQDPIKNMVDKGKEYININNNDIDISDYEVGYSMKFNKLLNIEMYNNKQESIKEEIKEEVIINKNNNNNKVNDALIITDIINMENMAFISSISFFAYTGYKIIKYIDNNI